MMKESEDNFINCRCLLSKVQMGLPERLACKL